MTLHMGFYLPRLTFETGPRAGGRERDFFLEILLVRIHFIIEMIWWTGLALLEFEFPLPGSLTCTFAMIWWTGLAPSEFKFPFPGSLTSTFLRAGGASRALPQLCRQALSKVVFAFLTP